MRKPSSGLPRSQIVSVTIWRSINAPSSLSSVSSESSARRPCCRTTPVNFWAGRSEWREMSAVMAHLPLGLEDQLRDRVDRQEFAKLGGEVGALDRIECALERADLDAAPAHSADLAPP